MYFTEILFIVIFIISLLAVFYIYFYNLFQSSIIRINEVEKDIDNLLRNKFELLERASNLVKANTEPVEKVFENLSKLKVQQLSSFEIDQKLAEYFNEFYKIKEIYHELDDNEAFKSVTNSLEDIEEQIIACRNYYNDNITEYNKLIKKFPSNIIGKISKLNPKPFFDGKDMYDNIYNDFKL